jgi:hypothetical protein
MWPNWSGETAVIVGTGPSAATAPLEIAQDKAKVFVIKSAWRLAPWADALYGLDVGWWIANQGVPKFHGLKFSPSPSACKAYRLQQINLKSRAEIQTGQIGTVGCGLRTGGGHSGFQALNLAIQFGAKKIVLVGFDMTLANGTHWKPNDRGVARPDAGRTESWRVALDGCAEQIRALGVNVLNASDKSVLRAYEKTTLQQALKARRWRTRADAGEGENRSDQSGLRSGVEPVAGSGSAVEDVRDVRSGSDRGSEDAER